MSKKELKNIFLAKNDQSILEHSKDVLFVLQEEMKNVNVDRLLKIYNEAYDEELSSEDLFLLLKEVCTTHDLGKVLKSFQKILIKDKNDFTKEEEKKVSTKKDSKFISHNRFSYILYDNFVKTSMEDEDLKNLAKYLILYHHAKYFFEKDYEDLKMDEDYPSEKEFFEDEYQLIQKYFEDLKSDPDFNLNLEFKIPSEKNKKNLKNGIIESFKEYSNDLKISSIKNMAFLSLLRIVFNQSDRKASCLHEKKLKINKNYTEKELIKNIIEIFNDMNESFDNTSPRSILQNTIVDKIVLCNKNTINETLNKNIHHNIHLINGATGCGKTAIYTKIFLKENFHERKQMFVVTPRNTIGYSTYVEYQNQRYFKNNKNTYLSFEINNSEVCEKTIFKNGETEILNGYEKYKSDIVFISIDKLIDLYNDVDKDYFYKIMNSLVVFDEFHEFYQQDLIQVYFAEIINVLSSYKNNKTLLISGTVNNIITSQYIDMPEENRHEIMSFNEKKIRVHLNVKKEKMFACEKEGFIVIFNTATKAQKEAIDYLDLTSNEFKENDFYVFHSRYNQKDKKQLLKNVLSDFNTNQKTKILFSGPIVQSSLNITTKNMFLELSNADNTIQRIGRLNRFAENDVVDLYILQKDEDSNDKEDELFGWKEYFEYQIQKMNYEVTINQLLKIYQEFEEEVIKFNNKKIKEHLKNDVFKKSSKIYENMRKTPSKTQTEKAEVKNEDEVSQKLQEHGLRGEGGVIVLPLTLSCENKNEISDQIFAIQNGFFNKENTLSLDKNWLCKIYDDKPFEKSFEYLKEKHLKIDRKLNSNENNIEEFFNNYNSCFDDKTLSGNLKDKTKKTNKMNCIKNKYQKLIDKVRFVSYNAPYPVWSDCYEYEQWIYLFYKRIKIGLYKINKKD